MSLSKLTLKQLRYLVALEDTGHFRRAAEKCDISQPSLSAQIQNLEEVLGATLVERGRTGTVLSPVGREVSRRARLILVELQGILDFSAGAQHGLAGTYRLGTKTTLGPYLLPYVVDELHTRHPDLNLYVRETAPSDLANELASGLHDIVLAQLPLHSEDFVSARLFREPLYIAYAKDHPFAGLDRISTHDLKNQKVLSLSPQYHLHEQIKQLCSECGATILRDYEGTSLDALRQMVGMGMGITFLPALYVTSELSDNSEIQIRQLSDRKITRSVGLVWRKSAGRALAYRDLAEIIREVVKSRFKSLTVES